MAFTNFGKTNTFGQPAAANTFGGFGATAAPSTPGTGFSFGATATTLAPSFGGFGNTTAPAFGPAATSNAFSFGATNTGAFGAPVAAITSVSPFSFGTTTTASNTGFGFGGFGTTSTFGGLGQQPTLGAPGQSNFSFGATNTGAGLGTGAFGTGGSLFGATSSFNTTGLGGTSAFGASTLQQPAQQALSSASQALSALASALSMPILFGDERDAIIAKWNQLQAYWGTGKGYYSLNALPIEFTPENPFSRFKSVGYSRIPQYGPEDGLIGLIFNKKDTEIVTQKQPVIEALHRIFGSKPTIAVCIEGIKALINNKVEVTIYILEKNAATGIGQKISSTDLNNYLQQPSVKPQLTALSIEQVVPKSFLSKEALQLYLEHPPAGIDPILWQQAKLDNPDPEKYIPVPIIGFEGLNNRLKLQQLETKQHQERLSIISEDIAEVKKRLTTTSSKIAEAKRKLLEQGQRLLRVMIKQEVTRKLGFALQPEEEALQAQLETVQTQLDHPTEFRGRLKELVSQIRLHNHRVALKGENEKYKIVKNQYQDIKQFLQLQSDGINNLVTILKEDMKTLNLVKSIVKDSSDQVKR